MTNPTYDLVEYAFYNEGTEDGSTIIGTSNNQQTLDVDTNYQCRFQIHNDNSKSYNNIVWTFEFNHEGNGWTDVSTSAAPIQAVDDDDLIDGDNCTNRLTSRAVYYAPNNVTEDGVVAAYNHGATYYTEILLSFQIPSGQVNDGDEILIRARESSADFVVTYTVTGDIDVNKGGTAYQRSVSDTVGITDTVTNVRELYKTITDSVGITDVISNTRALYKSISDSVGVTDVISTAKNLFKTLTDDVGVTDTVETTLGKAVTLQDSVGVTDSIDTTVSGMGYTGPVYATFAGVEIELDTGHLRRGTLVGADVEIIPHGPRGTFVGTEVEFDQGHLRRATLVGAEVEFTQPIEILIEDSVGVTDTLTADSPKPLRATQVFAEVLYSAPSIYSGYIQDSVGIIDTVSAKVEKVTVIQDSVGITDLVTAIASSIGNSYSGYLGDSVGITDTVSTQVGKVTVLQDTVGVTDSIDTTVSGVQVGYVDPIRATQVGAEVLLKDTDPITRATQIAGEVLYKDLSPIIRVTQLAVEVLYLEVSGVAYSGYIDDNVGVTDSVSTQLGKVVILQDSVGITDTIDAVASAIPGSGYYETIQDTVGVTDTLTTAIGRYIVLQDTVGVTDTISPVVESGVEARIYGPAVQIMN